MRQIGKVENGKFVPYANLGGVSSPSINVDSELSEESENPVQNKVITEELKKYLPKDGGEVTGTLKVQTLVLGSTPSDEIGAIWIE